MRGLGLALAPLALGLLPLPRALAQPEVRIAALDDVFEPASPKVPEGAEITFTNEGANPHTVTAENGSFDSGDLAPGESFTITAEEPGRLPYFCRYHGAAGGYGMAGTILVGGTEIPEDEVVPPPAPGAGRTLRVPEDYPTIQAAVDAAAPGDLVLIGPGTYREAVRVTTPYLTIRGTDRNEVILEGDFELPNGVHILDADGVTVENMTARHYLLNGFYWIGVDGYRGSYLTAYNNGDYGVYAFDSVNGQFDHAYASGHPDSGFYIGQCNPCNALVTDVLAENNALGWSGTNAGGNLVLARSEWRHNMAGIVPNTLDSELNPPQARQTIVGNWVHDNDNTSAPAKPGTYPAFGMGIVVAGGLDNVVERNLVEDHPNYGIAVLPNVDRSFWISGRNEVVDNVVRGSGVADLALGAPASEDNCFSGNAYATSAPPAVQAFAGCDGLRLTGGGGGDLGVSTQLLGRVAQAEAETFPHGDWRTQPEPPPQATMPGAEAAPPAPAVDVPQPIEVAGVAIPEGDGATPGRDQEVTVLGVDVTATSVWTLLISVYGYVLPLVLYATWVAVAVWDLVRREDLSTGARVWWVAEILLVPLVGPIVYYVFGRSPIPGGLRAMIVGGGLLVYVAVAALSFVLGSS